MAKRLYVANDHAGFELKEELLISAKVMGYEVIDFGCESHSPVDYPDFAKIVVEKMKEDPDAFGLLICGTGIGMSIEANRHSWIRAAVGNCGIRTIQLARSHNNANVLCLGARIVEISFAREALKEFLNTSFEEGRHQLRLEKISRN